MAVCERGVERRPSAGAVATEAAIGSGRGRASRASSGIRRYLMLLPRTTSSGSFQKRSPSREVQITSRRQMFIQLSQLTRWPLYVSPFLSSTSIGCPCDVRRSESGSTIRPPDAPAARRSLDTPATMGGRVVQAGADHATASDAHRHGSSGSMTSSTRVVAAASAAIYLAMLRASSARRGRRRAARRASYCRPRSLLITCIVIAF